MTALQEYELRLMLLQKAELNTPEYNRILGVYTVVYTLLNDMERERTDMNSVRIRGSL